MSTSEAPPDATPNISAVEVQRRLGVSYPTAKKLLESGRLKSINIGTREFKHYRTSEAWLAEFLGGTSEGESTS